MNLPTERPVGKVFLRRPNIEGAIEFRNVKFKYPGQQGLALDGVSFKINPANASASSVASAPARRRWNGW